MVYRKCYKGWSVPTRTINDNEFVVICGEIGNVIIEDKIYNVKKGEIYYFYPGFVHSLTTDENNPMFFYAIHFSYAFVNYNDNNFSLFPSEAKFPFENVCFIRNIFSIINSLKKLNENWVSKRPGYELISNALFLKLFFDILEDKRLSNDGSAVYYKIKKLIDFMQQNVDKKLILNEFSEFINLTPQYLSKVFKEATGYSTIEYYNKLKIDKAKDLLLDEDKKIKIIAESLGFEDEFYFSRLFKKIEGMSPKEFHLKIIHNN